MFAQNFGKVILHAALCWINRSLEMGSKRNTLKARCSKAVGCCGADLG